MNRAGVSLTVKRIRPALLIRRTCPGLGVAEYNQPFSQLQSQLDRIRHTSTQAILAILFIRFDHDTVHHRLDGVGLVSLCLGCEGGSGFTGSDLAQVHHLTIDTNTDEALLHQAVENLLVMALLAADHGSEDHQLRAFGQLKNLFNDLSGTLPGDRSAARLAGVVTMPTPRFTGPRKKQTKVVIDLRRGGDSRTRIVRGRPLLDRDRRRQALDGVDVRLLKLFQELARVSGKRLDIFTLPFSIDGVERQRTLARPRQTGNHHQPVVRDINIDALEVVFPGAAD